MAAAAKATALVKPIAGCGALIEIIRAFSSALSMPAPMMPTLGTDWSLSGRPMARAALRRSSAKNGILAATASASSVPVRPIASARITATGAPASIRVTA